TSQPAPGRFAEAFKRLLEDHDEVVSLHISEKLSGTCAAAVQGAEMTGASARIRVVDSEMVSMPLGLMALAASQMAAAGAGGRGLCAIVGHAAAGEVAERIAAEIEPGTDTLLVQPLGPVVGAHAGPGTVGVGCYPAELLPLGLKRVSAAAAS